MSSAKPDLALVAEEEPAGYRVDRQVGFILRKANQRHVAIFASRIADLTPPQFAALSKLNNVGETSQNQLGVLVAMDAATIKGVIDRLKARDLVEVAKHAVDKRRLMVRLTEQGRNLIAELTPLAERITAETLAPLSPREAATLLRLLARIA
jgi:DNA-binding MarR family transcriptional regulator